MAVPRRLKRRDRGQVLAFYAVLLPVMLVPLAAYCVDAAYASMRAADLQAATAQAAEAAAQQVDVGALRARSVLTVNSLAARLVAMRSMRDSEPAAIVDLVVVAGSTVIISAHEAIRPPFNFLPAQGLVIHSRASARLVGGYDKPSSR